MRRLLGTCLAVGLTLLYSRAADAAPVLEVTTTLGGADAGEYLVRVANVDAKDESGVLELRHVNDDHAVARTPFSVPPNTTRYFRLPGERGSMRAEAVAVTADGTFHAQARFSGDTGALVVFDIPPQDSERLHDFRVHMNQNITVTHAVFDESTRAPVLTRRAAVYDGIALVMVRASVFVGLPTAEREALTTWVRAGGAIAMSVKDNDYSRLSDIVGVNGSRLSPAEFGSAADLGLGRVYVLPVDPWTGETSGGIAVQEELAKIVVARPAPNHVFGDPWVNNFPVPSLDPNRGYGPVMAFAAVMLVVQALVTAFAFRRLAITRGMGPAYRFVVGSSVVSFAAVVGLGIYSKGGFGARARELSFADAASGESVAWVERKRTYFAGSARSVAVTPRDPANSLYAQDSQAVLRMDEARGSVVLDNLAVRPWETTTVGERGTTTVGGGVRISLADGKIVVNNATGSVLRHVIVSNGDGVCFALGDIPNGAEQTSGTPHSCTDFGPGWSDYEGNNRVLLEQALTPTRLVLLGQIEEAPTSLGDFRVEKRTTVLRVTGGAS